MIIKDLQGKFCLVSTRKNPYSNAKTELFKLPGKIGDNFFFKFITKKCLQYRKRKTIYINIASWLAPKKQARRIKNDENFKRIKRIG